jgi:branched-chain amino acid transport system ATP-binding protein
MASDLAVEAAGLEKSYGSARVLAGMDLLVPAACCYALLGPNGAGKTTLLRAVSGFIPVAEGSVSLFGEDVTSTAPYRRFEQGLCHIPEGRGVFRSLTVRENLVMQARKGTEVEAVERAVAVFPILGSRLAQPAGTLSGGQQQMLAMAAAYVREPRVILVDEASLGLAPLIVDQIFAFLTDITKQGSALLIVDQFVTRALDMATTAYVLRRGSVVFAGSAHELREGDLFGRYLGG